MSIIKGYESAAENCVAYAEERGRTCDPGAILAWRDDGTRYERGFKVGSEWGDGTHRRAIDGWPFSIYKQGIAGVAGDVCLCTGIASLGDAVAICAMLNRAAEVVGRKAVLEALGFSPDVDPENPPPDDDPNHGEGPR